MNAFNFRWTWNGSDWINQYGETWLEFLAARPWLKNP
jgi:hypothetical protein